MSAASSEEGSIRRKAVALMTQRDAGWSADEAAEFALWRAADPRHDAAVRRIEATYRLLNRLPDTAAARDMRRELVALYQPPRRSLSRSWLAVAGLAAAAFVSFIVWRATPSAESALFAASAGQARTVDLSDGSTLQMSGGSSVDVSYVASERRVTLHSGEVHFSVAKDPTRPFVVAAGRIWVRAVGTAFNVRRTAGQVQVLVTEGKVQVGEHGAPAHDRTELRPLFLVAGESATLDASGTQIAATRRVVRDHSPNGLGWSAPRLEFSNTPLSQVVERFNQYSRVQLDVGDPDLAQRPVGGTFDADQAEAFVNLLVAAGDVQAERVSETHIILRKAR